ncbi:MAG: DUF2207 domain-containing protein [Pirellulaceae bacterium]
MSAPSTLTRWIIPAILLIVPFGLQAQEERIHHYHSQIEVLPDASLKVTETIRVTAAGNKIRRGIYRDFPTLYDSKMGIRVEVPFKVVSVQRDGNSEPYHTEPQSNGMRVYVGSKDRTLPHGEYTYKLTYTTDRQLGYFDQHDELYWNVTGNGWEFPIDKVTAEVRLPEGVPLNEVGHEGYTGREGSKEKNLTSKVDNQAGTILYETTQPLGSQEGLTIVTTFPKGHVRVPTAAEDRAYYMQANIALMLMACGLLVVGVYYAAAWVMVGMDPPGEPIYPRYEPPMEMTPACTRYLRNMDFDHRCFAAAIISAAVKGHLKIEEDDGGEFTLVKTPDEVKQPLARGEQAIVNKLLSGKSIKLESKNHKTVKKAIDKLSTHLAGEYDGKLFNKNRYWLIPGWLLSALSLMGVAVSSGWADLPLVLFMSFWLSIWSIGCFALGLAVVGTWYSLFKLRQNTVGRVATFGSALFLTAFSIPFFVAECFAIGVLVHATSIWILPFLLTIIAINVLFWGLIKQPTVEGQRVRDAIEGFRMYLSTAERYMLERLTPREKTPELFEKMLPYAVALDVENEWAEKFSSVLESAAATDHGDTAGYRPRWYQGNNWNAAMAGAFAGGLSSALGSAVSSSSTAPGRSSGSGGGGSSGGGGGGGGGGGW